ncbi:MAG: hypothetical protein JWO30_1479 [Fibrobacteres bacterium]|nr:hypothetical protein [Fibrobacterota bacterium]
MAFGLTLSACDLTQANKADDETAQPATAATIVGIWRTDIPVTTTTPPTDVKVTMQVDAGGTMVLSQRIATGQPAPYDNVEIAKENWTWTVESGNMMSVKTTCEYKDPQTMQTVSTECAEPKTKSAAINVKGKAWTVVENGQPIVFRKD